MALCMKMHLVDHVDSAGLEQELLLVELQRSIVETEI